MTQTQHTPGPWAADKQLDRTAYNIFTGGFASAMCVISRMENAHRSTSSAEVAANAALIAAAPELLKALKTLTEIAAPYLTKSRQYLRLSADGTATEFVEETTTANELDKAHAVIAKATGSAA